MSLMYYITPTLIRRDPELVRAILDFEYLHSVTLYTLLKRMRRKTRKAKERSVWVRPYLTRRASHGHYDNLMRELALEDPQLYRNFLRLDEGQFNQIVERVRPRLQRETTFWRKPLDVGLRVAITLRFLATGETYKSLSYAFRVASNTISKLVPETCRAIVAEFGDEVMQLPTTPEGWKEIASGFAERWNFPHTVGAIDGKHIRITNPALGGFNYFNYKRYFSIVLLAVVDYDYRFTYMDVGAVGSESDAGVFAQSRLSALLDTAEANLPPSEPFLEDPSGPPMPYFLVGDDAFALRPWLLKPYPCRGLTHDERIYNYRFSRARRVVENAFGILANR